MIRIPKNYVPETTKAHYSPKVNRIFRKPTSVKRPSHRHNLSDSPKVIVPFHTKPFKATLKIGSNKDTTRFPATSLVSPKTKPSAITSRPKTFGISDFAEASSMLNTSELPTKQKYSDSGIPTEQLLQSYSSRASVQYEEIMELWKTIKIPSTPSSILKLFTSQLSSYEQNEILSYNEIYYIGIGSKKIKNNLNAANYGYDDERGDFKVIIGDHISYRYEILKILGQGSFGQVLRVYDYKEKQKIALKIIRNKSRFHKQAMVEIEVLRFLREKDPKNNHCVVHLNDNFIFRKHVCITFELLSINLYEFLKSNKFQGITSTLIKRFGWQILQSLYLLDEHDIIHCDLKPENILLRHPNHSAIKVIDFGSSCFGDKRLYTYIQSRFYRAPEIILGIPYTTSIDIWSFGCILVELHTGYPLFPGESEAEQLLCIMEVLGVTPPDVLSKSTRAELFFNSLEPKIVANSRGKKRLPGNKNLDSILKEADQGMIDLVKKCLEWDPEKRITPKEALAHEWMQNQVRIVKNSSSRFASIQKTSTPRHNKRLSADDIVQTSTTKNIGDKSFVFI
ncbi:hypothetical protein SteCoe_4937 [Stentor coeruleus]|uniref:dual-specificity kinase n=1 Tax=Stentor coeruleus TaxID=5963 RepID=A0A1R2CTJ8_9CILI|nr:hypothetical protein SteCoe_4937 [Stentor coeruleus]